MALKSARKTKPSRGAAADSTAAFLGNKKVAFAFHGCCPSCSHNCLCSLLEQVKEFLEGQKDYKNLKGDTGPLVYPAGFLYVYSALQYVTGGQVFPAQLPWWALALLCLSKRLHSIFVLRLFNDYFAMTLLHAALALILFRRWHLGLILFSAAVSIKMNVLLYAPPLFVLMLKAMNVFGVISALGAAALVQILLGLPFLLSYPMAYVSRAFNLGRVFIHLWSVNFKFIPERVFVSKQFAIFLLVSHLGLLLAFSHYKWCKHEGGLYNFLHSRVESFKPIFSNSSFKILREEHIVTTLFAGNFIGVVCARSLHYQFYSWYFYSLPYLLWKTPFPTILRLILRRGVLLECLSFQYLFIFFAPVLAFDYTLGSMVSST